MKINWRYIIATTFVEGLLLPIQLGIFYLTKLFLIGLATPLLINLMIGGIILFTWGMVLWALADSMADMMLQESIKIQRKRGE